MRLIDDGEWGSLLLENGTVEDISNNLVHLVVLEADRTWDQFFFFVKPVGAKRYLVEADFLETVASVKSRLLPDSNPRPNDSQIKLVYKWDMLQDAMPFDDEKVDVAVGCTFDLFVQEDNVGTSCQLLIKSTCFGSFVILADLEQTTAQLMERIQAEHNFAVEDQILMNLSGESNDQLLHDKTLAEQGVHSESVLALDIRAGAPYNLKVRIDEASGEIIDLQYNFNDTVEKLQKTIA